MQCSNFSVWISFFKRFSFSPFRSRFSKDFLFLANFIFPPDGNFRVHQYARHESTIEGGGGGGASNISLQDRREWLRSRCGNSYVRVINFTILSVPSSPSPSFPLPPDSGSSHPLFPGGLFGRPLLNLRPINQTIPYKFVTREIVRILGARGASFLSPSDSYPGIPRGNLSLRAFPTPSLFSARVYRRFRAHFYLSRK